MSCPPFDYLRINSGGNPSYSPSLEFPPTGGGNNVESSPLMGEGWVRVIPHKTKIGHTLFGDMPYRFSPVLLPTLALSRSGSKGIFSAGTAPPHMMSDFYTIKLVKSRIIHSNFLFYA
jgi:hypothetical protein